MSRPLSCLALLALVSACAPAVAVNQVPAAAQQRGLYVNYNPSTGVRSFITPEAPLRATGMIESPAPRLFLSARCTGENCTPTEVWLTIVRTAPDIQIQGLYAPLSITADGHVMRWAEPRYSAEQAGLGQTREQVQVPLTFDEVRVLAGAREVFGRMSTMRDFEVLPEGLGIFHIMAAALSKS
jgi:hypothetical protein